MLEVPTYIGTVITIRFDILEIGTFKQLAIERLLPLSLLIEIIMLMEAVTTLFFSLNCTNFVVIRTRHILHALD